MTLLARDITDKERRINPFNKKLKKINIKEQFANSHLNNEGINELRRDINDSKQRYSIAKGVISDLITAVQAEKISKEDHQTILKILHEKTDLFYRFSSKVDIKHGTDILSGILTNLQTEELKKYKAEEKPEKLKSTEGIKPAVSV